MDTYDMCPHGRHIGAYCMPCEEAKWVDTAMTKLCKHEKIEGGRCMFCDARITIDEGVSRDSHYFEDPPELETYYVDGGGDASYYVLPNNCKQLQDIIYYKRMDFERGNIFKAAYRWEVKPNLKYNLEKILWFASYVLTKIGGDPLKSVTNAKKAASLEQK